MHDIYCKQLLRDDDHPFFRWELHKTIIRVCAQRALGVFTSKDDLSSDSLLVVLNSIARAVVRQDLHLAKVLLLCTKLAPKRIVISNSTITLSN